jgi:ABC-type maltose transport system permease subunit
MWLLIARPPTPDAPYWVGRRWLAAADALVWPLLWVVALSHLPAPMGIVKPAIIAFTVMSACIRLHRALWANHRYQFKTWCWGSLIVVLVGAVLKLATSA